MKKYLLCLCCFLLSYLGASAQTGRAKQATELDSGKTFHFVNMNDINGKKIEATSLAGKTVVIDFWFIGCGPCEFLRPYLSKIADDYKSNNDIVFIAISPDSFGALKVFLKSNKFSYLPVGNGAKLAEEYGVSTYPLSLVINKKGIIIFNSYTERYVAETYGRIVNILKNKL